MDSILFKLRTELYPGREVCAQETNQLMLRSLLFQDKSLLLFFINGTMRNIVSRLFFASGREENKLLIYEINSR